MSSASKTSAEDKLEMMRMSIGDMAGGFVLHGVLVAIAFMIFIGAACFNETMADIDEVRSKTLKRKGSIIRGRVASWKDSLRFCLKSRKQSEDSEENDNMNAEKPEETDITI